MTRGTIRVISAIFIGLVLILVSGCKGPNSSMREQMQQKAQEQTSHKGELMDHIVEDITSGINSLTGTVTDTATYVTNEASDIYNEYSPTLIDKYNQFCEISDQMIEDASNELIIVGGSKEESSVSDCPSKIILADGKEIGGYDVAYFTDGDTFGIYTDDTRENTIAVRLIGIDTPESKASEEYTEKTGKENCAEGEDASAYTKQLLTKAGMKVYLAKDVSETDKYGRLLRYAYIKINDEVIFLNEFLLSQGRARLMTIAPDVSMVDTLTAAETYAKEHELGYWKGFFRE